MKLKKYPLVPYNKEYHPNYEHRKIDLLIEEDSIFGEGCYCLLSPENLIRYDDNTCFLESVVILCNDSKCYSGLNAGQIIPIKFNGEFRATADVKWLKSKLWEIE